MGAEVDGIDVRQRSDLSRRRDDRRQIGHGTERIRGGCDGDQPRSLIHCVDDRGGVQQARRRIELDEDDVGPCLSSGLSPRSHVGVVVERRHNDAVSGSPLASDCPGSRKREAGHVLPEHDLIRRRIEKIGCSRTSGVGQGLPVSARRKVSPVVGDSVPQKRGGRLDDTGGNLSPGRPVQPGDRAPILLTRQRWELLADSSHVKGHAPIVDVRRLRPASMVHHERSVSHSVDGVTAP